MEQEVTRRETTYLNYSKRIPWMFEYVAVLCVANVIQVVGVSIANRLFAGEAIMTERFREMHSLCHVVGVYCLGFLGPPITRNVSEGP